MSFTVDTICALSTPLGRAALALIRVSGPRVRNIAQILCRRPLKPRQPSLQKLQNSEGQILDEAVLTFFEAPHSYTGEDMLEISCHGNPVIVEQIIDCLVSRETRLAEPGEFTRRALANQKMGLHEVESLDLILNAPSKMGVRKALESKLGGISTQSNLLREKIFDLMVEMQSQLDFTEEDVGQLERERLAAALKEIEIGLSGWASSFKSSRGMLSSWLVALVGPPNSGKSTLFNALVGLNKAIVYDQPGTTRDYLEHELEMNGYAVRLVDTAGIRENPEEIERIGIEKSLEMMKAADLICWVSEGIPPPSELKDRFASKNWLSVHSKADCYPHENGKAGLRVSALSGQGMQDLKSAILPSAFRAGEGYEGVLLTSERQTLLVMEACELMRGAGDDLKGGGELDLVVEKVLQASKRLEEVTGGLPTEAVLRGIFARFCIGK